MMLSGDTGTWQKSARSLQISFLLMAICFSINHGCVTAVLGLATANLGDDLGGVSSGTLYISYTLSALLVATTLVHHIGAKWSLVTGLGLYCAYVAAFLVAVKVESARWGAAITGSLIGGTAAGWLWTAQGVYFARVAEHYAEASNISKEQSTSWLASLFACCYVGFEVIMKLASSFLYNFGSDSFVYTIFTILAVSSATLMAFVPKEPPAIGNQAATAMSSRERLVQAGKLLVTDSRMSWVATFEIMFGLSTSFINFYINGTIVKKSIGKDNIGYMTAIIPATAAILSIPYSKLTDAIGKAPVMIFGSISYLFIAVVVAASSNAHLESLKWGLVFLYLLGGNGRAVFEGTNKAMVADFFPNAKSAAFANIIITSGGASAAAFYVFPYMNKIEMASICMGAGVLAVIGIFLAFRAHRSKAEKVWNALPGGEEDDVTGVYRDSKNNGYVQDPADTVS